MGAANDAFGLETRETFYVAAPPVPPAAAAAAAAAAADDGSPRGSSPRSTADDDVRIVLQPLLAKGAFRDFTGEKSLADSHATVAFPALDAPMWRKLLAFAGLGFLVSVGYMDPGNWATDLAAGSAFGYQLLCVVLLSSLFAMFLQYLALKLGIATDRDLAQACRDAYHPHVNKGLWVVAELAIAATDLAEVIGSAIALNLLTGMPLWAGVLVTGVDVIIMYFCEMRSFRALEVLVVVLIMVIMGCFIYELVKAQPDMAMVMKGYLPTAAIITNAKMLYLATGILGATVMPHNLYLHSAVIQTRAYPRTNEGRKLAIQIGTFDSTCSLIVAFFINSTILIVAGAAFHYGDPPMDDVADIPDAYYLLAESLGARAASILFGIALLASGQTSTICGTLAGQVVMEGFLDLKMRPWLRRLVTRGAAIIPAAIVAAAMGQEGVSSLLILSQVILSLTLPFAVFPLVHFTSSKAKMGKYVIAWYTTIFAWLLFLLITGLNLNLVIQSGMSGSFGDI